MRNPSRILLIDDDPDDQLFFQDAIRTINPELHCEIASGFQEALRKLEQTPVPEIIFMDLNMPVMNGFDCLAYLKNQDQFKDIPIVIYTTSKNINDIDRTRQLGADGYLTKPDDFKVLCKKLTKIIERDFENVRYVL